MRMEEITASAFLVFILFGMLTIGESFGDYKRNKMIKAGELIILENSSYKCKLVNTLEEK